MAKNKWYSVDKEGLGKQAASHSKGKLLAELVQNALDEEGVTQISFTLTPVPNRPFAYVSVEDDSPEGFRDLSHAYTFFAESYKRKNPEQRGQFNVGEKLVLSLCESATISTTTGTVEFDITGERIEKRVKRERGSTFSAIMRLNRGEQLEAISFLKTIIIPTTVTFTINGEPVQPRIPDVEFKAKLDTVISDEKGVMRPSKRITTISLHKPIGDVPSIYEMGIPIVEVDGSWDIDIHQKIPLNWNRDNVTPAFLRALRAEVLNNTIDIITPEEVSTPWIKDATAATNLSDGTFVKILDLKFGTKRASFDPSDPEANKRWVADGGTIVHGASLSKQEWARARELNAIESSGKLVPTPKPFSEDPNAPLAEYLPETEWTYGMRKVAAYSRMLAREILGIDLRVLIVRKMINFAACYSPGELTFSYQSLGKAWFDIITDKTDALLIHEFAHHYCKDHLSSKYHQALCDLGAKLKALAIANRSLFEPYL